MPYMGSGSFRRRMHPKQRTQERAGATNVRVRNNIRVGSHCCLRVRLPDRSYRPVGRPRSGAATTARLGILGCFCLDNRYDCEYPGNFLTKEFDSGRQSKGSRSGFFDASTNVAAYGLASSDHLCSYPSHNNFLYAPAIVPQTAVGFIALHVGVLVWITCVNNGHVERTIAGMGMTVPTHFRKDAFHLTRLSALPKRLKDYRWHVHGRDNCERRVRALSTHTAAGQAGLRYCCLHRCRFLLASPDGGRS